MSTTVKVITREELHERATKIVPLASWNSSDAPRGVRIRQLTRTEFEALRPEPIPGAAEWPVAERAERLAAYLAGLTPEQRGARERAWAEVDVRIVATGVLEPPISVEDARLFGPDLEPLVHEILEFSGFVTPTPTGAA